jgi:hypothetical protein
MSTRTVWLALSTLFFIGCSNSSVTSPSPAPSSLLVSLSASGDVAAHEWTFTSFEQGAAGLATVTVSPTSLSLEFRTVDTCVSAAGAPLATSATGSLEATLSPGRYCARVGNPGDAGVHYSIVVRYSMAG